MNIAGVVFSGFRSADLEAATVARGGKVQSSITKATTLVVYDPDGKKGAKVEAARAKGIALVTKAEFMVHMNVGSPAAAPKAVKVAPKAAKECPEGKVRNPATGRCVADKPAKPAKAASPKAAKECPEGKVRNPATGRCVADKPVKAPKAAVAKASPKRLPTVWTYKLPDSYVDPYEYSIKYLKKIKRKVAPGDIVCPYDAYRAEGMLIVTSKGVTGPLSLGNGEGILPAWVIERGLRNGHSLAQLQKIYEDAPVPVVVYPRAMQGKHLKLDGDAIISMRAYDNDSRGKYHEVIVEEGDGEYFDDFNYPPMVSDVFL